MKHISVIGLTKDRKDILETLQRCQAVEVTDMPTQDLPLNKRDTSGQISMFERRINMANTALSILDEYAPEKKAMFEPRRDITVDDYTKNISECDDSLEICSKIINLSQAISDGKTNVARLEAQIATLRPWLKLDVPMNYRGTRTVDSFIGTIPEPLNSEELAEKLPDFPDCADINIINISGDMTCIHVLAHKSCSEEAEAQLRHIGFSRPGWSLSHLVCKEKIRRLTNEINDNIKKSEEAKASISEYGSKRPDIQFALDYLTMRRDKYEVISKLGLTKHAFILNGYVPANEADKLAKKLEKHGAYVEFSDVDIENEDVPVKLKNGGFVRPMESLTASYSMPGKKDIDPSPFMAFFYYLLYGLMFSDAGYGLLMTLATGFVIFFTKAEQKTKDNMRLFFYCGISTMFWGLLFGSWFGDLATRIMYGFFNPPDGATAAVWFDPIASPMTLIILSIIVGVIHIIVGLIAKFVAECRFESVFVALIDAGAQIIMLLGLGAFCAGTFVEQLAFLKNIGLYVTIAAFAVVIIGSTREAKGIKKLAAALAGVYNIVTGYLSDILSYSRLMALGLTTGAIGMVVNRLATLGGNSVVGYIMFVAIFIFGHAINLGINALGAYVHCNRLQYVELYKQFYEGGGRAFEPFGVNTKYYKFREEN